MEKWHSWIDDWHRTCLAILWEQDVGRFNIPVHNANLYPRSRGVRIYSNVVGCSEYCLTNTLEYFCCLEMFGKLLRSKFFPLSSQKNISYTSCPCLMEVCQTWRMERTTVKKNGIHCSILFLHLHVQVGPNNSKSCSAPCMSCLKIWREAFMPPLINLGRCFGLESHSDNVMPSPKMQAEHGHISWLLLQWSSMYLRPNLSTQTNLRFQGAVLHFYDKHHVIVLLKTCRLHDLKSLAWLRSFYLANLHGNPAHTCLSIFGSGFSPPMCWVFAWPHGSEQQVSFCPLSKAGLRHAYTVHIL